MDRSEIPLPVRVELAHAEIQAVARAHGVDALLVKGRAADPRLYVPGRISSDVDVLVRPRHTRRMVEALRTRGWETVSTFRTGSLFRHAQTMRHPSWGLVDVHRSFPGFELPPQDVFDALWWRRVSRAVAGYPCDVPQALDHALIILVHAARSPESRHQDVHHLSGTLTAADWDALETRAGQLGASVALAAVTGTLPQYRDRPSHDLWLVLSQDGSRSQEWRARLRAAPTVPAKLHLALRAPLPNVDHLRMDLGRDPTVREIARTALGRPVTAARELLAGRARRRRDPRPPSEADHVRACAPPPLPAPAENRPGSRDPGAGAPGRDGASSWLTAPSGVGGAEQAAPGTLRRAPDVAVVDMAGTPHAPVVCVARVPGGQPLVLNDSAAVIWREALRTPETEVVDAVASATGQDPDTVRADVLDFMSSLVTRGFLIRET